MSILQVMYISRLVILAGSPGRSTGHLSLPQRHLPGRSPSSKETWAIPATWIGILGMVLGIDDSLNRNLTCPPEEGSFSQEISSSKHQFLKGYVSFQWGYAHITCTCYPPFCFHNLTFSLVRSQQVHHIASWQLQFFCSTWNDDLRSRDS